MNSQTLFFQTVYYCKRTQTRQRCRLTPDSKSQNIWMDLLSDLASHLWILIDARVLIDVGFGARSVILWLIGISFRWKYVAMSLLWHRSPS